MAATQTAGVIATAVAGGGLANKQQNGYIDVRNKSMYDIYTTKGTEGVGSTIAMCGILPVGCLIRDITLFNSAITGGASISVGDSNSATRYILATATSAAAKTAIAAAQAPTAVGYEIGTNTGDNQLLLTVSGGTLAVGGTIQVVCSYAFD